MTPKKDLELYLHIPFCRQKCRYCDFLSAPLAVGTPGDADVRGMAARDYPECRERTAERFCYGCARPGVLRRRPYHADRAGESVLSRAQSHYDFLGRRYAVPFARHGYGTADGRDPGAFLRCGLAGYRRAGINRLSMGLQSACDKELAMLGRIHNFDTFVQNYKQARRAGFENINVDLMSALPGQTVESWEQTLVKTAELAPEHLSAYSLIIEEGTPFWNWYGEDANQTLRPKEMLPLPSEEDERRMYARTREILEQYGYHRYEISNYAKDGYACRHNIGYWNRTDYLGIGLGASSLIDPMRWKMTSDLSDYLECGKNQGDFANLREEVQTLRVSERMEEFMFLGLRLTKGIELQTFEHQFGKSFWDVYQDAADKLFSEQLLCLDESKKNLRLTDYGVDVSNYALAEFLLDY